MTVEHATEAAAMSAGATACETWSLATTSGLIFQVPASMNSLTTYVLLEQERWFEPEMSLLPRLLQPGMHTLDIGARYGLHALEMARCTQTGQVWAFEPTSAARSSLLRSVQDNGLADRVTVVAAGLAERDVQASFAVNDHPEATSDASRAAYHETVQLLALDDYLDAHAAAVRFGFVRLGADGGELQVLAGARRFFEAQSPVVLFQLKHGDALNIALIERWQVLGYAMFRWSAELNLLLPFDVAADETAMALNLVAVRPAQQRELAERGLLVSAADLQTVVQPAPEPQSLAAWLALSQQSLDSLSLPISAADTAYLRAMNAAASAHLQPGLKPAERVALLVAAQVILTPGTGSGPGLCPEGWALLVHCLHALGRPHAAVQMAAQTLSHWHQSQPLTLPFVPPRRADLDRPRSTAPGSWLRQVLGEFVATQSTDSSCLAPPCPERWAQLMAHPDHSAEVERRYMLSHMVQDRMVAVDGLLCLPAPEHTCNPALWQALLQAARAMAREPAVASLPSAAAVLGGLPVAAVTIVDVGASSLGNEAEPYEPLLRAGRAQVTGFEPDAQALQRLHQQFPDAQTHRFLPNVVGDGQAAVFHLTNWSLTASLLAPNRPLLDRYPMLGELMREQSRVPVSTTRLDDVIAPGGMDVLKIDVQGAEILVFDGAPQRLDECLVVWTEVEFVPLYRDQPLFGDIDARLRRHGLQFLCFAGLAHRALASWPQAGARPPWRQQQLWADAIYVPQPERLATLSADAAARLALAAHHMLGAYDLCHGALLRYDELAGSDFAPRYVRMMKVT